MPFHKTALNYREAEEKRSLTIHSSLHNQLQVAFACAQLNVRNKGGPRIMQHNRQAGSIQGLDLRSAHAPK